MHDKNVQSLPYYVKYVVYFYRVRLQDVLQCGELQITVQASLNILFSILLILLGLDYEKVYYLLDLDTRLFHDGDKFEQSGNLGGIDGTVLLIKQTKTGSKGLYLFSQNLQILAKGLHPSLSV